MKSNFKDLDVWKKGVELRKTIFQLTKKFPETEKFRLADQMVRASRSITANIAEGYGRFHFKENIQFCRHSRGSLFELIDQLITSKDEALIQDKDYEKGRELISKALALLNGYINYLSKQKVQLSNNK